MDAGLALLGMHWYKPAGWEMKTNYCFNFHKALPFSSTVCTSLCPHAGKQQQIFFFFMRSHKKINMKYGESVRGHTLRKKAGA